MDNKREYDIKILGGCSRDDIINSLNKIIENIKSIYDNPDMEYDEEWEDENLICYFS